jgi:hypothetical protein
MVAVPRDNSLNMLISQISEVFERHCSACHPARQAVPTEIDEWSTDNSASVVFSPCNPVIGLLPHVRALFRTQSAPLQGDCEKSKVTVREFPQGITTAAGVDSDTNRG